MTAKRREPKPQVGVAEAALLRSRKRVELAIRRLEGELASLSAVQAALAGRQEELAQIDAALAVLKTRAAA